MKTARKLGLLALGATLTLAFGALPLSAAVTGHFERTLQVSGAVDLEVTSGSGNISVHPGSSNTGLHHRQDSLVKFIVVVWQR
jgi:hypothetical protein